MGVNDHLVKNASSTARRSEDAGEHTHYLTYNPGTGTQAYRGKSETCIIPIRLPKHATNISLHGPGRFIKRGTGMVYGVRISFMETNVKGEQIEHSRVVGLLSPAVDVQLLDRKPDDAYRSVA